MPQVAFVGDIHGEISRMYAALQGWMARTGVPITAVVQVGDFGVLANRDSDWMKFWCGEEAAPFPTYALMGNHEDPNFIKLWQAQPDKIPNIKLLPDGGITDVFGVKIGTVWGNFSQRSWLHPERVRDARYDDSRDPRVAMHILRDSVDHLLTLPGPIDVLVTHEAAVNTIPPTHAGRQPSLDIKQLLGLDPDEKTTGCPGFRELLVKFEPPRYFFGHFHVYWEAAVGGTRVTCLGSLGREHVGNWCKVVHFPDETTDKVSE